MIDPCNAEQITSARFACSFEQTLAFEGLNVQLHADNPNILASLSDYYTSLTHPGEDPARLTVYLVSHPVDTQATQWTPVKRSKVSSLGLKEAYLDTRDGRWIHKVRTGMVMLQSMHSPTVFGDLQGQIAQVINFINNQFLNHHQRQGYLLGHASAFTCNGATTAIAASSGGGKSTLMLRALECEGTRFLSNDRILIKPASDHVNVLGVAKHPRVNPGTLLHSDRLRPILPEPERRRFEALAPEELWNIEQKYDVRIDSLYGPGKVELSGQLRHLVLLDWSLNDDKPTELSRVDIDQTPQALDSLRKSAGPFFQTADGAFPGEQTPSAEAYRKHLSGVRVWRLSGTVDFDRAIACLAEEGIV